MAEIGLILGGVWTALGPSGALTTRRWAFPRRSFEAPGRLGLSAAALGVPGPRGARLGFRGVPWTGRLAFAGRGGSLQLDGRGVEPVEPEVGLGEEEAVAAGGPHQLGDRADEVSDEGAQPVAAGGLGQQVELHGAQQHLRQLAASVKRAGWPAARGRAGGAGPGPAAAP